MARSLKKNAFFNIMRTVMGLIFPLITFPYSSRILLPDGIGKVNFATSIISYFSLIAGLGIGSYGIREAARLRDDREKLSGFIQELFTLHLFTSAIAYILFIVALFIVPRFAEIRVLLCICSVTILLSTFGIDYLYSAVEEFEYIAIRSVIFQVISVILLFTLVKTKDDYLKYASLHVFSSAGSNIMNLIHSRKYVTFRFRRKMHIFRHLKPCLVFFGISVAISLYTVLDSSALGFIKGDRAVGLYTAATRISRIMISVISALTAVLTPRLSFYAGHGETLLFKSTFRRAFSFSIGLSLPIMIGLFLLAHPVIIACSGGSYLDAVPAMRIMCPIIVIIPLGGIINSQLFVALRREKVGLIVFPSTAALNLIFNIILIPHFGVEGAAIATVGAESFVTVSFILLGRNYINFREWFKNIAQYLIACVVMSLAVIFCLHAFESTLQKIFISFFIGATVYFFVLLLIRNALALYVYRFTRARLFILRYRFRH